MKIEIALEEVESLRRQVDELTETNKRLQEDARKLDRDKLYASAVELAEKMFEDYWNCVCQQLGFDTGTEAQNANWPAADLRSWIENNNNQRDRPLKVSISAKVSEKFKQAFIGIGLDMDKLSENTNYQPLTRKLNSKKKPITLY